MTNKKTPNNESASMRYLSLAFISFIFIIIILSVGTQLVFSPQKVTRWVQKGLAQSGIETELNKADLSVSFDKAQTTFTGSIFYPVGVRILDFKVVSDDNCRKSETVFSSVVVPFSITDALKGRLNLGRVKLNSGLTKEINLCPPEDKNNYVEKEEGSDIEEVSDEIIKKYAFKENLEKLNLKIHNLISKYQTSENAYKKVEGLLIYDWVFQFEKLNLELNVERFKLATGGGDLSARAEWLSDLTLNGKTIVSEGKFYVYPDSFMMDNLFEYKEGELRFQYKSKANSPEEIHLVGKDIPLSLLRQMSRKEQDTKAPLLRKTWLNFESTTLFNKNFETEFSSLNLSSEGQGGVELTSGPFSILWSAGKKWTLSKRVRFLVTRMKLLNFLTDSQQKELQKILPEFGYFNSTIQIAKDLTVSGDYEAKDQSFLLSSMGQVGYQKIKSAVGSYRFASFDDYTFNFSQIRLQDGEFEGDLNVHKKQKDLEITFNIPNIELDKTLWEGVFNIKTLGSLTLKGEAYWSPTPAQNRKEEWSADFVLDIESIKSKKWTVNGPVLSCEFDAFLACDFDYNSFSPEGRLKSWFVQNNYLNLIKNLNKSGQLSYENKVLNLSVDSTTDSQSGLTLNWSEGLGTVLNFGEDIEVSLREL